MIAGLDSRLLTAFSLWLVSIIARKIFSSNTNFKFRSNLSKFVLILVEQSSFFVNNDKQLVESVLTLRIYSTKE